MNTPKKWLVSLLFLAGCASGIGGPSLTQKCATVPPLLQSLALAYAEGELSDASWARVRFWEPVLFSVCFEGQPATVEFDAALAELILIQRETAK